MTLKTKGAGASRADPSKAANLAGCGDHNSETSEKIHPSIVARRLRTAKLQARFGLSAAAARTIAEHAFGEADDTTDHWISLGDAAALAIDAAADAYARRR